MRTLKAKEYKRLLGMFLVEKNISRQEMMGEVRRKESDQMSLPLPCYRLSNKNSFQKKRQ